MKVASCRCLRTARSRGETSNAALQRTATGGRLTQERDIMNRSERASQIWAVLAWAAKSRQTLTYAQVGKLIGVPSAGLGQLLEPIQSYCLTQRLPPLTILVVQQDSGFQALALLARPHQPSRRHRLKSSRRTGSNTETHSPRSSNSLSSKDPPMPHEAASLSFELTVPNGQRLNLDVRQQGLSRRDGDDASRDSEGRKCDVGVAFRQEGITDLIHGCRATASAAAARSGHSRSQTPSKTTG